MLGLEAFVLACREVEVSAGVARRLIEVEPLDQPGDNARQNQRWLKVGEVADMLRAPALVRARLERLLNPQARQPAVVAGRTWTRRAGGRRRPPGSHNMRGLAGGACSVWNRSGCGKFSCVVG